jgi:hypothetical protein
MGRATPLPCLAQGYLDGFLNFQVQLFHIRPPSRLWVGRFCYCSQKKVAVKRGMSVF